MTPPQAQEAGIDFEEARRIAEGRSLSHPSTAAERFVVLARAYLALLATHEGETARYREALKAIGEVAFVANEGDPWYCEHEGVDVERAYRLYREAMSATEPPPESPPVEAEEDCNGSRDCPAETHILGCYKAQWSNQDLRA